MSGHLPWLHRKLALTVNVSPATTAVFDVAKDNGPSRPRSRTLMRYVPPGPPELPDVSVVRIKYVPVV